jgi:hypothetical protein
MRHLCVSLVSPVSPVHYECKSNTVQYENNTTQYTEIGGTGFSAATYSYVCASCASYASYVSC